MTSRAKRGGSSDLPRLSLSEYRTATGDPEPPDRERYTDCAHEPPHGIAVANPQGDGKVCVVLRHHVNGVWA